MARLIPSERFRAELDEALSGVDREADPVEAVGRLGARTMGRHHLKAHHSARHRLSSSG